MSKTRDVYASSSNVSDWIRRMLRGIASKTDEVSLSDISPASSLTSPKSSSSSDSDKSRNSHEDILEKPTASHVAFFDTTHDLDEAKMKAKEFAEIESHIQRFKGK